MRAAVGALLMAALACQPARAEPAGPAPPGDAGWLVVLEPKFMRPPVARDVRGSQRTVMAAAVLRDGGISALRVGEFEALGVGWQGFLERALRNIEPLLEKLKPELLRDKNHVLLSARLASDDPRTASVVLAPGFAKMFADLFGPEFLVAVPNRNTVLVFPKLAGDFEDYSGEVLAAYRNSAYPVSLEVFEVDAAGIRAIGVYGD